MTLEIMVYNDILEKTYPYTFEVSSAELFDYEKRTGLRNAVFYMALEYVNSILNFNESVDSMKVVF